MEPRARARTDDPATSHEAAASVKDLTASQGAVLGLLRRYPYGLTDVELIREYRLAREVSLTNRLPRMSESGIRTRRKELVERGLVRDTEKRKRTESGRQAIIWAAR